MQVTCFPGARENIVAGLNLTFWPNPVYRNHTGEMRWYFNVAVQEIAAKRVHVQRYRGEWYDPDGRLQDTTEGDLDMLLTPLQHLSFADLWVTSAIPCFRYRLILLGRDEQGQEVRGEESLVCH
jgi:hypothetical protein